MNFTYIYYLGSEELAPQEYNELVDDKPYTLWLWTESYRNYRFNFPEEIDPLGNYVVPETSKDYIKLYEEYGFEGTHVGKYYVFTNPWLNYSGENSDNIISWDHGLDREGTLVLDGEETTVLSGWALNSQYAKVWDDIIVDVDGVYYAAQKMEREDVANMVGNEQFLNCGFHVTLDSALVQSTEKIRVIFINYKDKACYVQEIDVE